MRNFKIDLNSNFEKDANQEATNELLHLKKIVGLMGIGKCNEAISKALLLEKEFISNNSLYLPLLNIIIGISLSSIGQHVIALDYYEKGLFNIKELNKWMYFFGKAWRLYSLSEMDYYNSEDNLNELMELLINEEYKPIIALTNLFLLINNYRYNLNYNYKKLKEITDGITPCYGGLYLQALSLTKKEIPADFNYNNIQGLLGKIEIIEKTTSKKINKYILKKKDYLKKIDKKIFENVDTEGNCSSCRALNCVGVCCYDGAYIEEAEKTQIENFMKQYPEHFDLNKQYFEMKNWKDQVEGLKIKTKTFIYQDKDYPHHFEKTACIFQEENGSCLLQRLAVEGGMHPWRIKPVTCWLFPIRGTKKGALRSPLKVDEKDPHFYDETYPGYFSYLPCGKSIKTSQTAWYQTYKQEIIYYLYLTKKQIIY